MKGFSVQGFNPKWVHVIKFYSLAPLFDSFDLARAELGIRNLEVTTSSKGSCTFDFIVPHSYSLVFDDESGYTDREDAIVARSGIDRVLLHGVVNPDKRTESDWVYVLFPGQVSSNPISSMWNFRVILFELEF